MQKVNSMTKEELAHYGTLIGEAFAAEGDGIATTAPREDIIKAFEIMTEYFYNSGVLYTTSDNHECENSGRFKRGALRQSLQKGKGLCSGVDGGSSA